MSQKKKHQKKGLHRIGRLQNEKQGRLRSRKKGCHQNRRTDFKKFKFSRENNRISQSKVSPIQDCSTERSSNGFVKEKNNSPDPRINGFYRRSRRAYRMPPQASQVTRTSPRTRKRKYNDEPHNQSTIRSKVMPNISTNWTNRYYEPFSSYSNLQSNSTQSLDMQHYSSADRPSLEGKSFAPEQIGNRFSVNQMRPLCAMLIDVPKQPPKRNSET